MERVWHGCENGILRDQTTDKGASCCKVKGPKFFEYFQDWAEEYETIGCISDTISKIAFFWPDENWIEKYFF